MKKLTVGIIATHRETVDALRAQINGTGIATVVAEALDNRSSLNNASARQVISADPVIIIVDISDPDASLHMLQELHVAAPNAHLLVTASNTDPQLMIELMRVGVREFLPSPVAEQALLQAFKRFISAKVRSEGKPAAKRGKLYCIASAKHGSGATTVAINMAGTIAARGRQRTALIDLDRPLGDVAAYLNVKPTFTVSDALGAGSRLDSVLLESYMQTRHGFHFLPGFAEHSADASLSAERLSQLLEVAQNTFEHTIVDLPTNLDPDQVTVITRNSSSILVILTPELPAIWRTERLLTYLGKQDAADKVRIVLNRATKSEEITDSNIERLLRAPIFCKLPNEYGACIKAINSGTLLEAANSKYLSKAIGALATEIAGLPEQEVRRSLFGMILKPSAVGGSGA